MKCFGTAMMEVVLKHVGQLLGLVTDHICDSRPQSAAQHRP